MPGRRISHDGRGASMPEGMVPAVEFALEGQSLRALNGGWMFTFNEAISFIVHCRLSEGGVAKAQRVAA